MNTLETAIEALTDTAARLEVEGFSQSVIADAFLSAGLSIGNALQGPDTTARVLRQLAQRFTSEAVAAGLSEDCDDPANRALYEAFMAATATLRADGHHVHDIATSMAVYAVTMGVKNGDRQQWADWLADFAERLTTKGQAAAPTQH